jgi:hypothetical protein
VHSDPDFDPLPLLEALTAEKVDFVVIGAVAGGVHGSAYTTQDLDIAYARDRRNLERLAAALRKLSASLRGAPPGLPFQLDAETLENGSHFTFATPYGSHFTFATPYGSLDILSDPDGAPPYRVLKAQGTTATIRGQQVAVASLDHLIAMKEASGRTKDKLMATEYRTLSDELRAPKG